MSNDDLGTGATDPEPDAPGARRDDAGGFRDRGSAWKEDAQESIDQAGQALRTAWDATRETRTSALHAAREATKSLAAAIEEGIGAARASWSGQAPEPAPGDDTPPPPPPTTETAPSPDDTASSGEDEEPGTPST